MTMAVVDLLRDSDHLPSILGCLIKLLVLVRCHDSCILGLAHHVNLFASRLLLQLLPCSLLGLLGLLRFLLCPLCPSLGLVLIVIVAHVIARAGTGIIGIRRVV